jgi:HAD superfamily hydrolase (TIGR01509 family)
MSLKAVLFDFNGVIINDEPVHEKLIEQLLIEENLRLKPGEYQEICLGRSDRACLLDLFSRRGRVLTEDYLTRLLERKSQAYQRELTTLEKVPTYPGVIDLMAQIRSIPIPIGVVSGAMRSEIELVLAQMELTQQISIIVAGDDLRASKPDPDGYLLAVRQLNNHYPELQLRPENCLAIEDTFAGIMAAKRAGMQVVGVANTYPYHMMQRQANWAVDDLTELELDRVQRFFDGVERSAGTGSLGSDG